MSTIVDVKTLREAGVHFGHQMSRWNPKMAPYIQAKLNSVHIINLKETIRGILRARHFLFRLASSDEQVLIVGTKRQVRSVVEAEAARAEMPCVTERWIGGCLTNYQTIRSRLKRLEELEALEASGKVAGYSKKEQSRIRREHRKIHRNLGGIRNMDTLPGAVIVADPKRENIAVAEANCLSIPVVAILDTDCDPDLVDIPIPGNDDAMRSVQVILQLLVDAVIEGKKQVNEEIRIQRKRRLEELEAAEREIAAPPRQRDRRRPGGRGRGPERGGGRPGRREREGAEGKEESPPEAGDREGSGSGEEASPPAAPPEQVAPEQARTQPEDVAGPPEKPAGQAADAPEKSAESQE